MSTKKRPPKRVRAAQAILDDALRHQMYLDRLKTSMVQDFDRAVFEVEKRTLSILKDLEQDNLGELTRAELNRTLSKLRNAQAEVYAKQIGRLTEQLDEVSLYSGAREVKALETWATRAALAADISTPSAQAILATVRQTPISATGELLEGFLKNYSASSARRLEGAIRNGHAQGKTVAQMVRDIRGTKARNYRDSIVTKRDRQSAEAVVRTSVQHVANTARSATWEKNSVENGGVVHGYIWVSTLDNVTTTTCKSLDKQKFKLNKGPLPPIHINCRSTTIPDLGPAFDFLDKGATRSAQFGPVSADQSYYDWLKRQPKPFIEDSLGKTRAKLFVDGGMTTDEFAQLNVGKNFEPLTLKEMREKDAAAFERAGLN
jgi:SPP1 gp7 family putative phage head morphogenesis protein